MLPPAGDTWIALSEVDLPVTQALAWASRPDCGGVVVFCGTVRDHAPGRPGVDRLSYEAYEALALPRLEAVADECRVRWPDLGALALLHRTGDLAVGDVAVVVVASAPHRAEAFAGARYGIDALKATVPVWKRERWRDGEDWGTCSHDIVEIGDLPEPDRAGALWTHGHGVGA